MIKYFKSHFLSMKLRVCQLTLILIQIGISLLLLKQYNVDNSLKSLFLADSTAYIIRVIFFNKVLIYLFLCIFMYDNKNPLHIPKIVEKGRFKFFSSKFLFFIFYAFIFYLLFLINTLVVANFFIKDFTITKSTIIHMLKPIFDFLLFILVINTFITNSNKSFSFIVVLIFILLDIVYKDYSESISFYKYLIPITQSTIYLRINGFIYAIFYYILFFSIYLIKSCFEEINE